MVKEFGLNSNFIPYKIIGDKQCIIMWDLKPIFINGKDSGYSEWIVKKYRYIPDFNEIKNDIENYYNEIIDNKILNGCIWKDMNIWLSNENQMNYRASYDICSHTNGENLPITFKFSKNGKQIYYNFDNKDELYEFYLFITSYIQKTIEYGWKIKDSIKWDLYK